MYLTKTEISHLEQGQDQFLCTGPQQLTVAPSVTDKGPGFQRTDAEVFLGAEHDVVESGALPTASMVQITIQPQPVHTPVEKQNKQFTYLPQSWAVASLNGTNKSLAFWDKNWIIITPRLLVTRVTASQHWSQFYYRVEAEIC